MTAIGPNRKSGWPTLSAAKHGLRAARRVAVAVLASAATLVLATASFGAPCIGDCNGNTAVTVDELIAGVNIALGYSGLEQCPAFESNSDGEVTVDELVAGVNAALSGCPSAPTVSVTPTPTATAVVITPPRATPTNTTTVGATATEIPIATSPTAGETPTVEPSPSETIAAPSVTPGVATNPFDAGRFLYEGAGAMQKDVVPGTIDPVRASIVRGRVLDRAGHGLSGVTVDVLDHPEYGFTRSVGDGSYALAVNGGGQFTINFERSGFVTVQRQVQLEWQGWAAVDDIVMTPLDTAATAIDLSGSTTAWQVHQASMQSDSDGIRRATLLFPPGVTGEIIMPDGSPIALGRCMVRVTEVTVGPRGEAAMPAALPPTSNYTYAASFDCDEALAAGTTHTQFSPSLPLYVENFLDFPVGIEVPYGVYDSSRGVWIGEPNGVVLRVTGIVDDMANLDLDSGDGGDAEADPELYATYGISDGERQALAGITAPGMQYWRVQVRRFSKGDLNWSAVLPPAAGAAKGGAKNLKRLTEKGTRRLGHGTIEVEEQVFDEDVGVVGVPFRLHYTSRRQTGRTAEYEVRFPITDAAPPAPLEQVVTELRVAGRVIRNVWTNAPNQTVTLAWDGIDAFGRPVDGRQKAAVRIGYVYVPSFVRGAGFAVPRSQVLRAGRGNQRLTVWTTTNVALGQVSPEGAGLSGWTPSIWHTYDPVGRVIHLGDGTVRSVEGSVLTSEELVRSEDLSSNAGSVLVDRDGSVIFLDRTGADRIRRYRPDTGVFDVIAGGSTDEDHDDGGSEALSAAINPSGNRQALALGPDGAVYWVENSFERVRRVRNGRVETVAGKYREKCQQAGDRFAPCGDGGPALGPTLNDPQVVAVLPDGSLLIGENASPGGNVLSGSRVRRVDPGGTISRFAGSGAACPQGDAQCRTTEPVLARETNIGLPLTLTAAPDGTVYLGVRSATEWVYEISPQGMLHRIACKAGSGGIEAGEADGVAALDLKCDDTGAAVRGLAVAADGTLHMALQAPGETVRILSVGKNGKVRKVAFSGAVGAAGSDGGPALLAELGHLSSSGSFGFAPDGSVVVGDGINQRFLRLRPALPAFTNEGILIPSDDASEVYVFDRNGRHLSTRDALTGATIWTFNYDGAGRLISIADREGDLTTIARDGSGLATSITGPDGDLTALGYDASADLTSVTNPANETIELEYAPGRLLTAITGPRGNSYTFQYDAQGRFIRTDDPAPTGGSLELQRTETASGETVTETTALGRVTTHVLETLEDGSSRRRVTGPNGLTTETIERLDDSALTTFPDGTTVETALGPDPRFGLIAPLATTTIVDTPALAPLRTTRAAEATLSDPADPLTVQTLTETETTNGKTVSFTYDASSRTITETSPAGRIARTVLDALGRTIEVQDPGQAPLLYAYDARGRATSITQGEGPSRRVTTLSYRGDGTPETYTDAESNPITLSFDAARRPIAQTFPEGGSVSVNYDADGNQIVITPPTRPAHRFGYTALDQSASYDPPDLGAGNPANDPAEISWEADRNPREVTLAGGASIDFAYDTAGRLAAIDIPTGSSTTTYSATTGNLAGLTSLAGGGALGFGDDGFLPISTAWSGGSVAGTVSNTYDADYRLASQSVNGAGTVSFTYDQDSRITGISGALNATITRDPATAQITRIEQGEVREVRTYDPVFAELTGQQVTRISTGETLYQVTYTRDRLGRLTEKAETIEGESGTTTYGYDRNGRLVSAAESGGASYTYAYDTNGNRTSGPGGIGSTYDAQDRLISSTASGGTTFTYSPDGTLASKTVGGTNTTTYIYDVVGNLREVDPPSATTVTYRVDGLGRRIERSDGVTTQRWLYDEAGRIVAELDSANTPVSQFAYATDRTTPEFMLRGGTGYRIIHDQIGSVRLVIDTADAAVAQRLDYDPFGQVLLDTNPGFQPLGFAGGLYDAATGLTRFGARDYDPAIGRWTAKDPILFAGGYTNLYNYVGSDPVNAIDPTGFGYPALIIENAGAPNKSLVWLVRSNQPVWARHLAVAAGRLRVLKGGVAQVTLAAPRALGGETGKSFLVGPGDYDIEDLRRRLEDPDYVRSLPSAPLPPGKWFRVRTNSAVIASRG